MRLSGPSYFIALSFQLKVKKKLFKEFKRENGLQRWLSKSLRIVKNFRRKKNAKSFFLGISLLRMKKWMLTFYLLFTHFRHFSNILRAERSHYTKEITINWASFLQSLSLSLYLSFTFVPFKFFHIRSLVQLYGNAFFYLFRCDLSYFWAAKVT